MIIDFFQHLSRNISRYYSLTIFLNIVLSFFTQMLIFKESTMENENPNLNKVQQTFNSQIENQKQLWEEEKNKAKELFEHLRQESINNFEQARHNIQRHIEEVNNFGTNLQSHLKNQPFDFQSFSKVFADYHTKQLELLSQATAQQTQKLSDFQNKLTTFYQDKQNVIKNEVHKTIDNTIEASKEVVEKIVQPKQTKTKTTSADKNNAQSIKSTERNSKPVKSDKNKKSSD